MNFWQNSTIDLATGIWAWESNNSLKISKGFPISPADQAALDSNDKTLDLIDQVENTPSLQNAQKLVASLPKIQRELVNS